ncbi:hypothetical protein PHYPO_G00132430 [Pangasianodon hypophthalmus]|uniref:Ig-like domain-containing protein n=1 Tax=Pangasianodon hypophthalmus TaxID=310915 RepID=A0A5N5KK05_PANHP|nr:hypothetical protein PHYPO_G00132430 [Pangasianodon hypophthalmus]
MLYLTQLTSLVLIALIYCEVGGGCPPDLSGLELDPPELVVQYGDSVSVSCRSSIYKGLGWSPPLENVYGTNDQNVTWETDNLTDWEIQPVCYMTLDDLQCNKTLPLIIYKLPDRVSISTVNHTGPMIEGRQYELQCDIQNIAPIHFLTVNWYKGHDLVSNISFTDFSTKIPVNQSTRLQIFPSRNDDGVQYRCEAKLNLGPEEPLPPPIVTSDPLNITLSTQSSDCRDLELDPPELAVQYGDPVSVGCRSLSNDTDLSWKVPLGNVSGPDNQTITWKTDNLTDWEIQPVCYMTLDEQCKKNLPLIIYKLPDQVTISIPNHTGPMIEGKKYDLQCDIQNFAPVNVLAVAWYNRDHLLKNRGFSELPTKTPSNKTVALRITASRDEQEAQYRCEAKLKLGPNGPQPPPIVKSNLLSIAVHYKPVIACSDWSPMINTPLNSYPYNVTGNPSPNITWYRDNSPVSSSTLLSRSDSGQYKYIASNVMGSTPCVPKITVEYAPTFKCPASYEGREHDSFLDKCSVMASPVANITWEKAGKTVNPLQTLTRGDSGSYVITAVNKHGIERHSLPINVLYGPEIGPDNSTEVVKEGGAVSLSCTAEGNPEPEVTWSFQSKTRVTGRRQTTLTISEASLEDDGVYTCTATNDLGSDTRTVSLRVEGDCPIKLQPVKLAVEFGASASANCSTTINHNGMGWEASEGGVDMVNDVQFITWRVESLTHWDIKPFCYINANEQCELTLQVTVYKRPDRVSISTVGLTGPMIEGSQYELQCDVQNVAPVHLLTVNWYKGQHLVKSVESDHNSSITPVNYSNTLWISTSKDDDGVQYRCEAELKLGPEGPQPRPIVTSDPLNITVHYKPVIACSDWTPMINTPLNSYPYNVTGNPSPNITWYRDNSPVSSITLLSRSDSGQYKYIASNVMGSTPCVPKITVEYAPTFKCPASYEGREHDSFLDKCLVMASPVANITWEKAGKTVNPLQTLTRGDSGSYVITAVNKHGIERHSLPINVLYGPEIGPDSSTEVVKEGGAVSLSCTAEGNPEPEVTWSFQSKTRVTGRRQTTLTISEASLDDDGVYTCTATNDLGSDTRTVSLRVEGDCHIELQPVKLAVEFGASASANCSTTTNHHGMGWEASEGAVDMVDDVQFITWRVESLTHWDIEPLCYINTNEQCELTLQVTVYKRPDRVSISTVRHTGPMIEGSQYELQCDVQNVAPVHLLTVNWYKGQSLVKSVESDHNPSITPVNYSKTLWISTSKDDDGVQYRCEAELKLGPEGPRPRPIVTSDPLNITVHYGPEIQHVEPSVVVKVGNDISLHCTAEGNPEPEVRWSFQNHNKANGSRQAMLKISKAMSANAGVYTCTARNDHGSDIRTVSLTVEESNFRTAIIWSLLLLLILLIIMFGIRMYVKHRRSGRYNIQANGAVHMSLLNQNDGQGMTTTTEHG